MKEKPAFSLSGGLMLFLLLAAIATTIYLFISSIQAQAGGMVVFCALAFIACLILLGGLLIVNPNEAQVLQLFGTYVGTLRDQGFRWVNPFTSKRRISLRVRNFETSKLKVNDLDGNPIEIAAVVVWQVVDTAEAVFQVDSYENFVQVQSESALRTMATSYAYDSHVDGQMSLRSHTAETAEQLKKEIHDRLQKAGVEVIEARISHLAYAAEIASAMLQRQQASAIVAARQTIVTGAVSMVEMALEQLSAKKLVDLDPERRAAMVSNLLVVLCGERGPQPVVNTGTLYT
ncbi:MAG TPA: SPFH domain-containing protein [Candidatus Limnocylindria bacterium]|nr:SPFH domain-containing protein [Candidatus Limnocylindria bacterium]